MMRIEVQTWSLSDSYLKPNKDNLRIHKLLSLQGQSSVCCTVEAVRKLEQSRGMENISRVLTAL